MNNNHNRIRDIFNLFEAHQLIGVHVFVLKLIMTFHAYRILVSASDEGTEQNHETDNNSLRK